MAFHLGSSKTRLWTTTKLLRLEKIRYLVTYTQEEAEGSSDADFMKKLIYSSKARENANKKWFRAAKEAAKERKIGRQVPTLPKQSIALKLYAGLPEEHQTTNVITENEEQVEFLPPVVMPMGLKVANLNTVEADRDGDDPSGGSLDVCRDSSTRSIRKVWSNDYVNYTHAIDPEEPPDCEWTVKYGSSNPKIPSSHVPCGGCGAMLHCKDASIPGFIPQEIFTKCKTSDLRTTTCQRCYFLQNHNTALSIAVNPKIYPQIISTIKKKNALVLLAIDVTDFPCSIWPGITDLVGLECPLFLVGNKVDLLWGDSRGWMQKVEKDLRSFFPPKARILGTQLTSAKTGFGVEDLISKLQQTWKYQGDVYLVGCTNVGKSTLFNALLQSDYCKVKAADLVQRATTAPWPGTTLNLLKFPIMRPEGWRIYLRTRRLRAEATRQAENSLKREQLKDLKHDRLSQPQLIGHIGRTFHVPVKEHEDAFASPDLANKKEPIPGSGLNPNDPEFAKGRWFYDTPGVLHRDQILDILTTEELIKVLPQTTLTPTTYTMKPGWTMFIGGIARIDFISGSSKSIKWALFVSKDLPVTICWTADAKETYEKLLGSEYFGVPSGEPDRLAKWPGLDSKNEFKFSGIDKNVCCGDVVLSSCGWVSFAPVRKEIITVRAWTPEARGIYTRPSALLPHATSLRGHLIKGTPVHYPTKLDRKS